MGMALASVPIPHGLKRENREAREFFTAAVVTGNQLTMHGRVVAGANTSDSAVVAWESQWHDPGAGSPGPF